MCGSDDLASALRKVAQRIQDNEYVETCEDECGEMITRGIQDVNGNRVGKWSVENTSMETPDKPKQAYWLDHMGYWWRQ
jgi:hypothetical protein